MLFHYLRIAIRNFWKHKTQNIISIIGLAVGFACFAFSALWIRYEMSYDGFHPKADRIYRMNTALFKWEKNGINASEIQDATPYPLAYWLKSNFPEIEDACGIDSETIDKFSFLYADSSFCKIFDVNLPEGFFAKRMDHPVALTNDLKGMTESIKEQFDYDVQAIIPRWQANTNIPFNTVVPIALRYTGERLSNWGFNGFDIYILIKKGTDVQALEKKLDKVIISQWPIPISFILTPLKQLRYKDPSGNIQSDIKFSHIRIFSIAGLLVILCSLFNHLTLYFTRVRMRLRELTLHKVNGATDWQIAAILYIDFLLVIFLSLLVGFMLMAVFLPTFKEYATIETGNAGIYVELLCYAALLIACGFVAGGIPVFYFRKQALSESIKGYSSSTGSRNVFIKVCLLVQLIVSLGLMFCSAVFIKQIRFLTHTDLGINRRNIAAVSAECCPLTPPYAERIRQIPGIIDALPITRNSFLKNMSSMSTILTDEKDGEKVTTTFFNIVADAHFFDFFGVELIEGTGFSNECNYKQVVNETAMKELGDYLSKDKNLVGVARDFYLTPTTKAKPINIWYPDPKYNFFKAIAYRYEENRRSESQEAITQWMHKEFPNAGEFGITFTYMEDVFQEYFKSERALLSLLSVMTGACILIAVFGIYSLTSLSCQQRRKEIALRKINGAEVLDIMNIFFKESLVLLTTATLFAFPSGYFIMERWLQGFVKQTTMDSWLYILIFLTVFIVIVFSTVSMVWKTANINPIEAVKTE